ncbi:hypothetical protein [Asticcacaulis sp.]|uniref:hypothetical protein n=1 Tax=Asticcacaulis sp. TaxID=1872648 RepID=UPI0031CED4BE
MAHKVIQWRQVGFTALVVVAAHMALALLFMISRPRETPSQDAPTLSEVWFVPSRGVRSSSRSAQGGRHTASPAYRQPSRPPDPSGATPSVVASAAPPSASDDTGRETLGAALRHGQACRKALMNGTALPPDCPERGVAPVRPLPVKPGPQPYWEAQVAATEAERRYRSEPGNVDYWKRVNGPDSPRYTPPDLPAPGVYSTEKGQFMHDVDGRTDAYYKAKRETLPKP